MIPWTVLAIAVGLMTSLGAFGMALFKLRKDGAIFEPIVGGLRWLAIAMVSLYICLLSAGGYVYLEAQKSEDALCSLRSDLETRVIEGEAYLKSHPKGILDIPAKQIKESIDNQKRTISALDSLEC